MNDLSDVIQQYGGKSGLILFLHFKKFDRFMTLFPENLAYSPCWKQNCTYDLECITMIDLDRIMESVSKRFRQVKEINV